MKDRNSDVRYETKDIDARLVFFTGAGVFLFATAVVLLLYFLYSHFRGAEAGKSPRPPFAAQNAKQVLHGCGSFCSSKPVRRSRPWAQPRRPLRQHRAA